MYEIEYKKIAREKLEAEEQVDKKKEARRVFVERFLLGNLAFNGWFGCLGVNNNYKQICLK